GKDFGAKFSYEIQEEPRGLADAFIVGERFIDDDNVTMILGDNIFDEDFSSYIKEFQGGGVVFAKEVNDPQRYGVIEFDENHNVLSIIEKPQEPKSNYAMVGLYILDKRAAEFAKNVKPSARGEIEIPDVINQYREKGELKVNIVQNIWEDAGTFESLLRVNNYMAKKVGETV
ncbi:MAG TPA: sugar phosphate nucleotidyltransferase, partial [Patescibacteria group bacterium]|nr:sugar phosphate nucleotidyltransferase [Patescibacteria group bacterium]